MLATVTDLLDLISFRELHKDHPHRHILTVTQPSLQHPNMQLPLLVFELARLFIANSIRRPVPNDSWAGSVLIDEKVRASLML